MSTASKATITLAGEVLVVITPHTADFPEAARKLHGRWNGHAWVFSASQLEQVEALCLQTFDVVEVENVPAFEMPETDEDDLTGTGAEVTIPGLTEGEEEDEDTAVTQVERLAQGSGSASDSESAPVRMVMREVDSQAAERAAIEEQERTNIEAEIDRLTKRLRFLLDRLSELDDPEG